MTPKEAEELFLGARKAVRDLGMIRVHREDLARPRLGSSLPTVGRTGAVGNPTAQAATVLADMDDVWREQEAALREQVAECQRLCQGVGLALGVEHGLAMEYHYLWDLPWKQVADRLDVRSTTVFLMRRTSLEYVAEVGKAAAIEGRGRAEE